MPIDTHHRARSSSLLSRRPDISGYYASGSHEEALSRLSYLVEHRRPCGLLTGPAGTGKSVLWEVFSRDLRRQGLRQVGVVDLRGLEAHDLPAQIQTDWKLGPEANDSPAGQWDEIQDLVRGLALCRTPAVFIFDHLDRAHPSCKPGVERLLRLGAQSQGFLTMLFAARSAGDSSATVMAAELSDLRIELQAFDALETSRYVVQRLSASGFDGATLDPAAMMAVYRQTHGVPREINRVCDLLVLTGLAGSGTVVSAAAVEDVSAELPQIEDAAVAD